MLGENLAIGDVFGPLDDIQAEKLALKNCKICGWQEGYNELILCLKHFEFLNPRRTKSIQYIGDKFLRTGGCAMSF